jgi:hypothetical protein
MPRAPIAFPEVILKRGFKLSLGEWLVPSIFLQEAASGGF